MLRERIGWWIACALEVRVVGTLEQSPPCRSCGVSHLRARPRRVDHRVRTEYLRPLVSSRLLPPEGHLYFIDVDQVCRYKGRRLMALPKFLLSVNT